MNTRNGLGKRGNLRGSAVRALSLVVLCALAGLSGCTRHYFRNRADDQVAKVLAQKDKYPDWKIDQYHIYPDPRARFADPTNPDHPPMPPDDPAAKHMAPNPQVPGHAGVARVEGKGYMDLLVKWDQLNRAEAAAEKEREAAKDKTKAEEKPEQTRGAAKEKPEVLPAPPAGRAAGPPHPTLPPGGGRVGWGGGGGQVGKPNGRHDGENRDVYDSPVLEA